MRRRTSFFSFSPAILKHLQLVKFLLNLWCMDPLFREPTQRHFMFQLSSVAWWLNTSIDRRPRSECGMRQLLGADCSACALFYETRDDFSSFFHPFRPTRLNYDAAQSLSALDQQLQSIIPCWGERIEIETAGISSPLVILQEKCWKFRLVKCSVVEISRSCIIHILDELLSGWDGFSCNLQTAFTDLASH